MEMLFHGLLFRMHCLDCIRCFHHTLHLNSEHLRQCQFTREVECGLALKLDKFVCVVGQDPESRRGKTHSKRYHLVPNKATAARNMAHFFGPTFVLRFNVCTT